ncbi:MAG: NUDIX hydrolase [Promethearchaeota archaeon]
MKNEKDSISEKLKLKLDLRKYPVRPHVGVGTVLINEQKLLLIKRKYNPDANKWAIPGGHLELGERCKDGAERETLEETGIRVRITDLAGIIDKIMYDNDKKVVYHYVLVNYNTEIIDGRFKDGVPPLKAQSDALDIKFVPFERINNYTITDSLRELLNNMGILKDDV